MHYDILILEDSTARLKKIAQFCIGNSIDVAFNAAEGISKLKTNTYDFIMLDHDLEPEHYEQVDEYELANYEILKQKNMSTGQAVADYIAYNKVPVKLCIIHSLNPSGGLNMKRTLERHEVNVLHVPSCWTNYPSFKDMLITHNKDNL
jgi:Na+-transporting NADH:ubiquinone oxidoreductase subunit NqrF